MVGAPTILFNLVVDILYAWIDPKIRYWGHGDRRTEDAVARRPHGPAGPLTAEEIARARRVEAA
ncbi:hypothetical protein [Paracoccus sp. S3-43]|uniref:hypothetical protein n=1 Tax=Paracoccus sp. S3-43 TaxID=3030011 RepID=UPI0023B09ED0|nr:hypothetical protein [Paracoccus sp. S3-43]WEF26063.1 hypothetical protein PXD02_07175 [Paracoccus sp. S3-43]